VKRCTRMEVVGKRPRGRPRKTWMSTLKDDMKKGALLPEDARDRDLWRSIHGAKRPTRLNLEMLQVLFRVWRCHKTDLCVCELSSVSSHFDVYPRRVRVWYKSDVNFQCYATILYFDMNKIVVTCTLRVDQLAW
jgi:hypothetical protein